MRNEISNKEKLSEQWWAEIRNINGQIDSIHKEIENLKIKDHDAKQAMSQAEEYINRLIKEKPSIEELSKQLEARVVIHEVFFLISRLMIEKT